MGKHHKEEQKNSKKTRFGIMGAGVLATGLIAMSFNGTIAGFSASIANTINGTATGTLTMQETNADGTVVCNSSDGAGNSATCSTINKYGGGILKPGTSNTTSINIKNTGSLAATSFDLTPEACTQKVEPLGKDKSGNDIPNTLGTATDFCSKVNVKIVSNNNVVYEGSAGDLAAQGKIPLTAPVTAGTSVPFTWSP